MLWPDGLSAGSEYIFWLASGINLGAVLLLGWRYSFVILLNIFPAVYILGEPWGRSALGAVSNCLETLLAWGLIVKFGRFTGQFDKLRPVLFLLGSAMVAPMLGSLLVPMVLVSSERFTPDEFWAAVGNWNLANGAAMLVLAPLLVSLFRGPWRLVLPFWKIFLWTFVGLASGLLAFDAVFHLQAMNFAFLVFPFVILVAVRFGPSETAAALTLMLFCIYLSLVRHGPELPLENVSALNWFLQAFLWILAATGYVVSAVSSEQRAAEAEAQSQKSSLLEAGIKEERARLKALRYQIQPHFLFNTLNSIRATLPPDAMTSRDMVTELSNLLRATLDEVDDDTLPLKDEVQSVIRYLAIEKLRFRERLIYQIDIEPETKLLHVPSFILQPLVENALRYGARPGKDPLQIQITSKLTPDGNLRLEVINSGIWKTPDPAAGSGLGMNNVRRRLRIVHGERATFSVESLPERVKVVLEIPHGERLSF